MFDFKKYAEQNSIKARQIQVGSKIFCEGQRACLKIDEKLNSKGFETRIGCDEAGMWSICIESVPDGINDESIFDGTQNRLSKERVFIMGDETNTKNNCQDTWKIRVLQHCANILVFDRGSFQDVLKNREGERDIESCKSVEFIVVKMTDLPDDEIQILKDYEGKNVWLKI